MARKDLTALAALGTLGYMLSKKGDKKDEKQTAAAAERRIAADKEASVEPQSTEDDSGMDPMEAANKRTERTLTNPNAREFGEAGTSMTVSPSSRPTASKPAARKPVIKSRPMSAAGEAAFQEANASPRSFSSDPNGYGMDKMTRKSRYTTDELQGGIHGDAGYGSKRGGLLKAKKMASGGMTSSSASKRADGIATKGKTRGRMV
jgi:hypothetical protein